MRGWMCMHGQAGRLASLANSHPLISSTVDISTRKGLSVGCVDAGLQSGSSSLARCCASASRCPTCLAVCPPCHQRLRPSVAGSHPTQ